MSAHMHMHTCTPSARPSLPALSLNGVNTNATAISSTSLNTVIVVVCLLHMTVEWALM